MAEPRTLFAAIEATAARARESSALSFVLAGNASTYTFASLIERARDIANGFEGADLAQGHAIGILLRTQEAQVLHYLGALCAGLVPAILTPPNRKLNAAYYAETTAAVLKRSPLEAVVSDVEGLDLPIRTLSAFSLADVGQRSQAASDVSPAALIQFSSGTTGIKRGVPLTAEVVLAQVRAYGNAIGLTADDVIVSWLPLYHDMGFIACLNMPLVAGVHTVMLDPIEWVTDPSTFLRTASTYGASLAWNPNFAYAFMAERIRDEDLVGVDLRRLRGLVNCSEPVTDASQEAFCGRFQRFGLRSDVFWGCYAMAETTFALTHGTAADVDYYDTEGPADRTLLRGERQISVGRPLPSVELLVVDDEGNRVPDRVVGELWVRSPFNFHGYVADAAATEEAFVDGWYRTGDLGYALRGSFYVLGRRKDVLIVSGVNVFAQDVESLVSDLEGVVPGRVSAFSTFDPSLQTERIAVLMETTLPSHERRLLVITARQRLLASFQIANFDVRAVDAGWLVKSTSGKMARSANRAKWIAVVQKADRSDVG